jgi:hypothetical protein
MSMADLFYGHPDFYYFIYIYIYLFVLFAKLLNPLLQLVKQYCTSKHDLDWLCTCLSWD